MNDFHDPYAALRHSGYRRLLIGNMLGSVGNQMQSLAVGWELYQRTDSALDLGLVGLVQFLPVVFLSLPAGQAADHFSRKGLLLTSLALAALASAALAALSFFQGPIPLIYVCLFLVGVARAFMAPARWSLVHQLVPESALGNAITWNSSGWQVASMSGPALGGLVIAATGKAFHAYLIAVLCSIAVIGLLLPIRPRPVERSSKGVTLQSFLAGVRFVFRTKLILATITLDLFAVLFGGATALLPIFARDILQVGPSGLGWLRAAPSFGAFLMALTLAHRPPLGRAGLALLASVAGFGAATIVFGLSRNFTLSFAMLLVTGALDNVSIVVRGTLVQLLTPEAMRGRVSAVNTIFIVSSNDLGDFESGLTAKWFGPVASVVIGGVGSLIVVAAVMGIWPGVLRLGSLRDVARLREPEGGTKKI